MTFRSAPLRTAATLAAGFIALRIAYRILFHGADTWGRVLFPLPAIPLPRPFSHVVLLGPVTVGGVVDAALSALPIAALILAFGVLTSLVDVPRLLAHVSRQGPLRGISRALAMGLSTLPALSESARRVRQAQNLRDEGGGVRLLAPLLERTLERARNVSAALELRGLAGSPQSGDCIWPIDAADVVISPATGPALAIRAWRARSGTLTVITGPTGSGKTTLLRALAGLLTHHDGGALSGDLRVVGHDRTAVPPRDLSTVVGVVLQNPRDAFSTDRVDDEIGLPLALRGRGREEVAERVAEISDRLGITHLLSRNLSELSAGEATLVALAAAVIERPILLLADEPLADLDDVSRRRVVRLLDALAHQAGICVVVAEHRPEAFTRHADAFAHLAGARLVSGRGPAPAQPVRRTRHTRPDLAIRLQGVPVRMGEIVALSGPNGAGKTSLMVRTARAGIASLVPDDPDDLFVSPTVAAECERADRRAKAVPGSTLARFAEFVGTSGLGGRHPRDLSTGQRRLLALAVQTASSPRALLVDEATRGLDPRAQQAMVVALERLAAGGAAVVIATHDEAFARAVCDRILPIHESVLGIPIVLPRGEASVPLPPALVDPPPPEPATIHRHATRAPPARYREGRLTLLLLVAANLIALGAFAWPLVASALPSDAMGALAAVALAIAPLAAVAVFALLDGSVRSAQFLAMLGTLAAIGTAVRVAGTGVGGLEAVFVLLILAGRAYGARFGLLLGATTIALSSLVTGGVGPWMPFQMFATAWVGAGAGLLPRAGGRAELALLAGYGAVSSYLFGLIMNLWFWPFAVGGNSAISYVHDAPLTQNLSSFLLYTLVTSTATWDTLRAITTVIGILAIGGPVLRALRRSALAHS